jgi:RsiW-degrading membrane proteinase PrsW (M82 family)
VAQQTWVIALSGALPALAAMWLVDRLDAKRPEPLQLRLLVAGAGMLSVVPAFYGEHAVDNMMRAIVQPPITYQGAAFQAFGVAAMIEEACKIAVVYWIVWWRPEFDERMDGIVYACRAGLGFALVENVLYLLHEPTVTGALELWVMRAVLAVPGHAVWTGVIGAFAARRRFDGKGLGLVGGYLAAVAMHGTYDLAVFVQTPLRLEGHDTLAALTMPAVFAIAVIGVLVLRKLARTALRLDDADARVRRADAKRPLG